MKCSSCDHRICSQLYYYSTVQSFDPLQRNVLLDYADEIGTGKEPSYSMYVLPKWV